ncbi:uncharacterized protein CPUR_07879 [Claviceps purpurea 20.1]|uniref:ORP1 like protein n=1 Tax=Claviceps purpurea (strain 20.1) TaxID=1111077 RepID=M1W581_CLAP2|nr:uncharacterized protein CPUR_07879 [Claviceps purpurea 20.1]
MAVSEDMTTQSTARHDFSHGVLNPMREYSEAEEGRGLPEHQSEGSHASRHLRTPPSPTVAATLLDYRTGSANLASNMTDYLAEDDEEKPVCMFVDDCDTGSQLRKAISHLFGRNKTCTLKIPKMVWVYYCRKHYQRVRYRNARTYPVTQMELVETQIERLKAWSDENQARGKGAYIRSWALSLRKREEKRLKGNKGPNDDDDDGSAAVGPSHIPAWIIDELGDGFDTGRMFGIAARLREEIESGALNQVPEIEFLPDIVDDDSEKDDGRTARHRRQTGSISTAKHSKRKASGYGVVTEHIPTYGGEMSYQSQHPADEAINMSPSGKRPRTVRAEPFTHNPQPSSDLHGPYVAQPPDPYMAPAPSYGFGAQEQAPHPPPRAQNVVPKMQPLEFTHHHAFDPVGRHRYEGAGSTYHGHGRMSSYQEPREVSNVHHPEHHRYGPPAASASWGQHSGQYHLGRSNSISLPTLPPIVTQMHDEDCGPPHGNSHYDRHVPSMRHQSSESLRPLHQRSASAYTPRSRFGSMPGRLSMTGDHDHPSVEHARYEDYRRPPSPSPIAYDPARHDFSRYGRYEWPSDHSHAPQSHPQSHLPQSHIPQSHPSQSHPSQSLVPQSHAPRYPHQQ